MSAESRIQHLWNAAQSLEADNHTKKLIKSYYLSNCASIAKNALQLPTDCFTQAEMCTRCFRPWNENEFKMRLISRRTVTSASAKKLIAKFEESKTNELNCTLTRKQKTRAKWLKKQLKSYIEITCQHCQNKTKVELQKPKKKRNTAAAANKQEQENIAQAPKAKKHKKKDKLAGLKIELPPKSTTSSKTNTEKHKINIQTPNTNNQTQLQANKATTNKSAQPIKAKQPTQPINKLNQTAKSKKQKKKENSKTHAQQQQKQPAIVSKTQQQNTILQLATLLKNQAKNKTTAATNRLEMFLK